MKRIAFFLLSLFIASQVYATNTLLIDRYYSPFMGSADLLSAQHLMLATEDYFFEKKQPTPNSGWKILGRSLEQFFIWQTIDTWLAVTQHEIFGHGYRLRELGFNSASYIITPWGGATSFNMNSSTPVGEDTAVTVAGLEADAIMGRDIKMAWLRSGAIDGRMMFTYNQTAQSIFWYTLITKMDKLDVNGTSGNDVSRYSYLLNHTYNTDKYTRNRLMRDAYFNLLDPMTFYAYYAFFYYIGTGEPWKFPLLSLSENLKYLPNIRVGYAPYAPEYYLENFLVLNGEPLYFYAKGGVRSFGAGIVYDKIWSYSKGDIGFRFDFWNQNKFVTSTSLYDLNTTGSAYNPELKQRIWGVALSVTGTRQLSSQTKLYGELGAKSAGYLPGYALGGQLIARIGLQI